MQTVMIGLYCVLLSLFTIVLLTIVDNVLSCLLCVFDLDPCEALWINLWFLIMCYINKLDIDIMGSS